MRSGTELSQFLRLFLPTLDRLLPLVLLLVPQTFLTQIIYKVNVNYLFQHFTGTNLYIKVLYRTHVICYLYLKVTDNVSAVKFRIHTTLYGNSRECGNGFSSCVAVRYKF